VRYQNKSFNDDSTHVIFNLTASSHHPVDFRANWKYNHGDEKMQSFLAKVPIYVQWDDHEVSNNWWFGEEIYLLHVYSSVGDFSTIFHRNA